LQPCDDGGYLGPWRHPPHLPKGASIDEAEFLVACEEDPDAGVLLQFDVGMDPEKLACHAQMDAPPACGFAFFLKLGE